MLSLDQACRSFLQSVQSTWPHHSQAVGENHSIVVNGCGQLLLNEGRADNAEAMHVVYVVCWILTIFSLK